MTETTRTETRTDAHGTEKTELDRASLLHALGQIGQFVKAKGYESIDLDAEHAISGDLLAFAEHCPAKPWREGGRVEAAWSEDFGDGLDIEGLDEEEAEDYADNLRGLLLLLESQVKGLAGLYAEAQIREEEAQMREEEAVRESRLAKWEADEARREVRRLETALAYSAADNAEGFRAQLAAVSRGVDRNAELVRNFFAPRVSDFGCKPAQLAKILAELGSCRSARIIQLWVRYLTTDGAKGAKPPADFTLGTLKTVESALAWARTFAASEKARLRTRAAFANVEALPSKR